MATGAQTAARESRWIELNDFTAGIFSDYHAGGGSGSRAAIQRNGAATVENTYRCVGDPRGGLGPLPRLSSLITDTPIGGSANATSSFHPSGLIGTFNVDLFMLPQTYGAATAVANDRGEQSFGLFVAQKAYYEPAGTGAGGCYEFVRVRRWSFNDGALVNTSDIWWDSSGITQTRATYGNELTGSFLTPHRATGLGGTILPNFVNDGVTIGSLLHTLNTTAGHGIAPFPIPAAELPLTTYDTDVSVNYNSANSGGVFAFPDPAAAGANASWNYNNAVSAYYAGYPRTACLHQNRVVWAGMSTGAVGLNASNRRDLVSYTPPLDIERLSFTTGGGTVTLTQSGLSLINVLASVSVDELFIVRQSGGATLVRGDMDNPTVNDLPAVESTSITHTPARTPLGVVYGSERGVYLWAGGDASQKLSPQLDGFFWDPSGGSVEYNRHCFRFGYWNEMVWVPNDWVYDTRTGSWWRSQSQNYRFSLYFPDPTTDRLILVRQKLDGTNTALADSMSPTVLAQSWSWQSQPLIESRDRLIALSEMELVVSPGTNINTDQTITATITGYDKNGAATTATCSMTFSGASGAQPQIKRKDLSAEIVARYIQVRFVADGGSTGGGNGNAPKLLSARFAVRDNNVTVKE